MIVVDWTGGSGYPYGQASGNSRLVGVQIAELIRFLISSNSGSPGWADRFYIVGNSLGAQPAGYAGRSLRERGMVLGRITGEQIWSVFVLWAEWHKPILTHTSVNSKTVITSVFLVFAGKNSPFHSHSKSEMRHFTVAYMTYMTYPSGQISKFQEWWREKKIRIYLRYVRSLRNFESSVTQHYPNPTKIEVEYFIVVYMK